MWIPKAVGNRTYINFNDGQVVLGYIWREDGKAVYHTSVDDKEYLSQHSAQAAVEAVVMTSDYVPYGERHTL